ncbi:MAG TPA: 6-carboxytetrahydropterin synthase [Terriglobia bacterium]|nr:6-carboxytetrahydropterin synthase [Terriglobia bacterium]
MRIFIEDTFDAAHWLPNVPESHKCHRMHGHTYGVRMEFGGEMDSRKGWVVDYGDVQEIWQAIRNQLDHRTLNDLIPNSTCENLALYIVEKFEKWMNGPANLVRLEIRERANTGVVWERP